MQLHETQAGFTASEAHWLQWSTILRTKVPDLADLGQRLLNTRISLAGSEFSAVDLSDVYDLTTPSYAAVMRLGGLETYERQAYCEDGIERPCIEMQLSTKEQALILHEADLEHQVAFDMASIYASGKAIDLPGFDIAIAEVSGVQAAFDFAEFSTSPETIAEERSFYLQETLEKISLMRGIMTAIVANH